MKDHIMMYLTERGLSQDGLHSLTAEDVRELIAGHMAGLTITYKSVKIAGPSLLKSKRINTSIGWKCEPDYSNGRLIGFSIVEEK